MIGCSHIQSYKIEFTRENIAIEVVLSRPVDLSNPQIEFLRFLVFLVTMENAEFLLSVLALSVVLMLASRVG